MLKIIDEFDLKGLEKLGFKEAEVWGNADWVYDFVPYTEVGSSYLVIYSETREVVFDYVDFFLSRKECFDLMYELINSGIVEKVEE